MLLLENYGLIGDDKLETSPMDLSAICELTDSCGYISVVSGASVNPEICFFEIAIQNTRFFSGFVFSW